MLFIRPERINRQLLLFQCSLVSKLSKNFFERNEHHKRHSIKSEKGGGELEELKWVAAAKKGDNQALAYLFKSNYSFLVHYLIKLTYNLEEAEDLAQETMTRAIEHIGRFNGKSKFSTWLISIGTKLYIDHKRKRKRADSFQRQEQHFRQLRWQAQTKNEDWDILLEALGKLEDELRVPIILKHYYGYAYEDIAKMLQIAEGTVKSRVHRGIQIVRKELVSDEQKSPIGKPLEQG